MYEILSNFLHISNKLILIRYKMSIGTQWRQLLLDLVDYKQKENSAAVFNSSANYAVKYSSLCVKVLA